MNKKRFWNNIIFIIVLLIYVFSLNSVFVSAGSLGLSPAKFSDFFEPGFQKEYNIRVISSDSKQLIEVYVKGDLAEYVSVDKDSLRGGGELKVFVNLPENIEKPGNHRILVGVKQVKEKDEQGIGGLAAIQVPIDVFVPYPGKYAEIDFGVSNINKGELLPYTLKINNLGKEDINAKVDIKIYKEKKLVKSFDLGSFEIESKKTKTFQDSFNIQDLDSGVYTAVAVVDYGKEIKQEKEFKIGTLEIKIISYTKNFQQGKINKFDIGIESFWNEEIKDVYASVSVTNEGIILDQLKTPEIDLKPWASENLTGFVDFQETPTGKYKAGIYVHYSNKSEYKLVYVYVKDLADKPLNYLLIGAIIVGLILIIIILYLIIVIMKLKNNKKSKK